VDVTMDEDDLYYELCCRHVLTYLLVSFALYLLEHTEWSSMFKCMRYDQDTFVSSPVQKLQLHRGIGGLLYERKKAGGCAPLSQWTTSHGTLSPYSSYGHDAAKMPKLLQPLILFLQILQFWGNAEDFGKRKVGLQGWLDLSRRKTNNFLSIFGIFTSYTIQSTLSPVPRTVLRYTLGRLRDNVMEVSYQTINVSFTYIIYNIPGIAWL